MKIQQTNLTMVCNCKNTSRESPYNLALVAKRKEYLDKWNDKTYFQDKDFTAEYTLLDDYLSELDYKNISIDSIWCDMWWRISVVRREKVEGLVTYQVKELITIECDLLLDGFMLIIMYLNKEKDLTPQYPIVNSTKEIDYTDKGQPLD